MRLAMEKSMFKGKMRSAVRPDIFITGVMKGGTTILHEYICTHPNIVSASKKEIHYFSLHHHQGARWYEEHFRKVPSGRRTIDASPTYFDVTNTSQIPRLLKAAARDPRVIIITRDPVLRALSHFSHLKNKNKMESLQGVSADEFFSSSFEDAFCQTGRFGFPLHQVLNFSLYTRKFITFRQELDAKNLLLLDNGALRENAREEMGKVFEFLDEEYVDNPVFGEIKYSNNSGLGDLNPDTFKLLAEFLYKDYRQFCAMTQQEFNPLSHPGELSHVA